jgi:hypothetical protein
MKRCDKCGKLRRHIVTVPEYDVSGKLVSWKTVRYCRKCDKERITAIFRGQRR